MKKLLLASTIASLSVSASADVVLPNIGIDGWDSDSRFYRSAAFNQGYLTATKTKNHVINPAYALDMMNSAEARMDSSDDFSAGVFAPFFGQNLGLYLSRPTYDSFLYRVDIDGDGSVYDDDDDDGYVDSGHGLDDLLSVSGGLPTTSVLDAYWAANTGAGKLGVRVNYRASSSTLETDMADDSTDVTFEGGLYEFHTTVGLVSNSLPLEATVALGVPFGGYESVNEDEGANTKDEVKAEVDKGLRWGATAKYQLSEDSANGSTLLSGYIGSAAGDYYYIDEETVGNTVNAELTFIQEYFTWGLVASHEKVVNNRTRLIGSIALNRVSGKVGYVNENADPSQAEHDTFAVYWVPVAMGVEFRKSEKTTLIGGASAEIFNQSSGEIHDFVGGDTQKTEEFSNRWYASNSGVDFGLMYQMTPQLETAFVINKDLFSDGLDSGLTTTLQFNYGF